MMSWSRATLSTLLFVAIIDSLEARSVNIDEILSKKKQLRLLPSISYINLKSKNALLTSIPYQMPDGSFIRIPITNYTNLNQDYLNFSLSARYGIYERTEIFSSLSAFWQQNTTNANRTFTTTNNGNFNTWNLGFLVEAKKEGKFPLFACW
ncbi:hypothetical protein [Helicobacter aurati]|uniref:hypothetical protein n=1 Tax=Helicobacter aurati TaxID=137778 RepID=UPI001F2886AD|nr:hypothetical protein [Helicobacter aurati]